MPQGTLVLHVGGEFIEGLFDCLHILHLLQHRQMRGKVRPPAIGGGEPVPRDIRDLEMGDVGSVFLCHVAALLISVVWLRYSFSSAVYHRFSMVSRLVFPFGL